MYLKGVTIPNKVPAFDEARQKRIKKIDQVMPSKLVRAKKYRDSQNWKDVRAIQKGEFPMCYDPFKDHREEGTTVPMAQVHHIYGLATHFHLRAYDRNLASLCVVCHDKVEKLERRGKKTQYLFRKKPEY